jgi:hypothetical protein
VIGSVHFVSEGQVTQRSTDAVGPIVNLRSASLLLSGELNNDPRDDLFQLSKTEFNYQN